MGKHYLIYCNTDDIDQAIAHITSGMKRGSVMSGKQRASWTMSRPVTPEYNIAMQQFTNLSCTTTKQHKDSPEECMKSDAAYLDKISSKSVVSSP